MTSALRNLQEDYISTLPSNPLADFTPIHQFNFFCLNGFPYKMKFPADVSCLLDSISSLGEIFICKVSLRVISGGEFNIVYSSLFFYKTIVTMRRNGKVYLEYLKRHIPCRHRMHYIFRLEKKFPMHDFKVEAHGSIIDVSLAAYFTMVKESELILRSLMPLLLQHTFGSRNSIPDELQKLVEVEVETGMIDGEMDAISSCSLFSNFLFANARYEVF
ncbi:hypothetical protein L3X38_010640 [Prunus dulcis]|uniref:Uncharacterized protein n=1 Tax=Prunus dulcis TaxID=3755 RepID=A0AAD4WG76_PRUDU|nr:hypothetical protein L3X38_010640 [Prunus dulcis]